MKTHVEWEPTPSAEEPERALARLARERHELLEALDRIDREIKRSTTA